MNFETLAKYLKKDWLVCIILKVKRLGGQFFDGAATILLTSVPKIQGQRSVSIPEI